MTEPKIILDQDGIRRALTRIAFEIVEKNKGAEHLLLAGVKTRGIYLAQRIAAKLGEVEGKAPPVLELDVTPWRDDVPRTDAPLPDLDPRIAGATVIIVDDVLYTGRTIRAALPDMLHRQNGSIVIVSSMWGERGASCESHYAASKAALIGLSKSLALELGPSGIRVNCVAPGVIDTDMNAMHGGDVMQSLADETPLERIGRADEVADSILYLCSEKASFVTGQVLGVTGGF